MMNKFYCNREEAMQPDNVRGDWVPAAEAERRIADLERQLKQAEELSGYRLLDLNKCRSKLASQDKELKAACERVSVAQTSATESLNKVLKVVNKLRVPDVDSALNKIDEITRQLAEAREEAKNKNAEALFEKFGAQQADKLNNKSIDSIKELTEENKNLKKEIEMLRRVLSYGASEFLSQTGGSAKPKEMIRIWKRSTLYAGGE